MTLFNGVTFVRIRTAQLLDPWGEYVLTRDVNWCFYSLVPPAVSMSSLPRDSSFFIDVGVPAEAFNGVTTKPMVKQVLNQIY